MTTQSHCKPSNKFDKSNKQNNKSFSTWMKLDIQHYICKT